MVDVITLSVPTLGELIRRIRQQKQMTLAQVSRLSAIPKGTLSKIENGATKAPNFQFVLSVGLVLDIPIEDLIMGYIQVVRSTELVLVVMQEAISRNLSSQLIYNIFFMLLQIFKKCFGKYV